LSPLRRRGAPFREAAARCRAGLRERECLARDGHRPQEAAAHQPVDAVGQLRRREAHEIRVVEKVSQSQIAAWTGHLELLEENEGGPLRTVEPGLRHGCTSAFRAVAQAVAYRRYLRKCGRGSTWLSESFRSAGMKTVRTVLGCS